jgi:ABC-type antimicrobial peptide transport system permease subunit
MRFGTLILRGVRHHWRSHLGVTLGAAAGSAILAGALIVGDSVRHSLLRQVDERLGPVAFALASGDRFFTPALVSNLPAAFRAEGGGQRGASADLQVAVLPDFAVAGLRLAGTIARQDGAARANRVEVLSDHLRAAVAEPEVAGARPAAAPGADSVVLNRALAAQLRARTGDVVVVRFAKPSALSQDVVLTPREEAMSVMRLTVAGIVSEAEGGNLSLEAHQTAPLNVFVDDEILARQAGVGRKRNLLLAGGMREVASADAGNAVTPAPLGWRVVAPGSGMGGFRERVVATESQAQRARFQAALARAWSLEDAGLSVRHLARADGLELVSERIFLDPAVVAAAEALAAQEAGGVRDAGSQLNATGVGAGGMQRVLTYFANQLRAGERMTPYSMVAAAESPLVPAALKDDEMVINSWLAEDLRARVGDAIELSYYVVASASRLLERTNRFRVHSVVALEGAHGDRTLMPEFPGLARAETTHEWDAGFPLMHKIREQDEAYWQEHRGTPKAFVTLAAGQAMWANRFGELTAVRFAAGTGRGPEASIGGVAEALRARVAPEQVGLVVEAVRERMVVAASQGQDFGQLFLGFSLFLITSALILVALLFQFATEARGMEVGTLLAMGFTPARVRRLFLAEGAAFAGIGAALGVLGALGYARLMVNGLMTLWRDAVGAAVLRVHYDVTTLGLGFAVAVALACVTIVMVLRRQGRQPAHELLAGIDGGARRGRTGPALWTACVALLICAVQLAWAWTSGDTTNAGLFFGAASALLAAGLALGAFGLAWCGPGAGGAGAAAQVQLTTRRLVGRTIARRRARGLATAGLLGSGTFLIIAVSAFRLGPGLDAANRASGTGGFMLLAESALPVTVDLNSLEGRELVGLNGKDLADVNIVAFRLRAGEDASCLNLNRAQKPRLLGVAPEALAERGAFTFTRMASGVAPGTGWLALRRADESRGVVQAIGDAASIQWSLGKKLGETLFYTDERGRDFELRLAGAVANSILQGNLVIDEAEFARRFPGEAGYRFFLIDAPRGRETNVAAVLSRALQDYGFEVVGTADRLAQFNAVQNTYLGTFQMLAGLGLVLGSAGLGAVVLRNVLERRAELALLAAVGWSRARLTRLVALEHWVLLGGGLGLGLGAAAVAVLPAWFTPGAQLPYALLAAAVFGTLLSGMLWTWVATCWALRGPILEGLRND